MPKISSSSHIYRAGQKSRKLRRFMAIPLEANFGECCLLQCYTTTPTVRNATTVCSWALGWNRIARPSMTAEIRTIHHTSGNDGTHIVTESRLPWRRSTRCRTKAKRGHSTSTLLKPPDSVAGVEPSSRTQTVGLRSRNGVAAIVPTWTLDARHDAGFLLQGQDSRATQQQPKSPDSVPGMEPNPNRRTPFQERSRSHRAHGQCDAGQLQSDAGQLRRSYNSGHFLRKSAKRPTLGQRRKF